MDINKESLALHEEKKGKLEVVSKVDLKTKKDLSLAYTPGVAEPCREIAKDISKIYKYTIKQNTVAVVTDGSAVLGLGNIGAEAALPVMEGKCILLKEFAGIDAFPICIKTQDPKEIVHIVKNIAPVFGGINLEDISAPRCFEVENELQDIGIPVFHDDQHGTAIVVLAALKNALKVVGKKLEEVNVVVSGAGAAGISVAKMLTCIEVDDKICSSVDNVVMVDSAGIINKKRNDLNPVKRELVQLRAMNRENIHGGLADAVRGADVFIGVSAPGVLTEEMVRSMNNNPIVFAMANPVPEIMPHEARAAGAAVVGTGRSDFPNQVNNALAFPGIFRGALDAKALCITPEMKHTASQALACLVEKPTKEMILPSPLDKSVALKIAEAVKKKAIEQGVVRA
ncbi:NADP-dependent malic enzyme [Candidatus Woesearchaeota archaeon]|nr:NADP-dependent malic enzyme [Candidatus Woesearchaeota archaeon]